MNREIDPSRVSTIDTKDAETDEDSDPVVYLDGYDYIGYIEIPAIKLKLPVMATWDYERLNLAPCRQFGSAKDRNLVIAAHNFDTHFGKLGTLIDGLGGACGLVLGLTGSCAVLLLVSVLSSVAAVVP